VLCIMHWGTHTDIQGAWCMWHAAEWRWHCVCDQPCSSLVCAVTAEHACGLNAACVCTSRWTCCKGVGVHVHGLGEGCFSLRSSGSCRAAAATAKQLHTWQHSWRVSWEFWKQSYIAACCLQAGAAVDTSYCMLQCTVQHA
jgi:hypothetical protein